MSSSVESVGSASVRVLKGDLFKSEAHTLVNTVNCVGVMGKGIALAFKGRFPDMYEDYVRRCEAGKVRLGHPYLYRCPEAPHVLLFPTKGHWRAFSRLDDIVAGLEVLATHADEWGIESLAVPPLGCGNGGLEWQVVGQMLHRHLSALRIPVELYAPWDAPSEQLAMSFLLGEVPEEPRIGPEMIAVVEVLNRLEAETYVSPTGRVKFQKLAYFATAMGIRTGLQFRRSSCGPYSEELKPMLGRLINNGVLLEQKQGQMFRVRPGPTYADARERFASQLRQYEDAIESVRDLLARMDTRTAELAATVDFAALQLSGPEHIPSEREVLDYVSAWKQDRQPPFDEEQVADMIREMAVIGRLNVRGSKGLPLSDRAMDGA